MATQKALVIQGLGKAAVTEVPIATAKGNQVIVKTSAINMTPNDPYCIDHVEATGCIVGSDYAGMIESVGDEVGDRFKVGDRVAGFVLGSETRSPFQLKKVAHLSADTSKPDVGAFAEYVNAHADLLFKTPEHMTAIEAANCTFPLITAGLALYHCLGLPHPSSPAKEAAPILIIGGQISLSAAAIQLAKLSNFTVITTCRPHIKPYAISIGASVVYDDQSPTLGKDIAAAFPDLSLVFDIESSYQSNILSDDALRSKGGHQVLLYPYSLPMCRKNIKTTILSIFDIFKISGDKNSFEADNAKRKFVADWLPEVEDLLEKREVKILVSQVRKGGLEALEQGIDDGRNERLIGDRLIIEM